ncbi:MAG: hypothetical protein KDJ77_13400 [Rhodobiaceae bacterium]|nr:hypothetical protein [Rhodobiaceae bacterium]
MKGRLAAAIPLLVASQAFAQSWEAGPEGISVPASVSGVSVPGATISCRADVFSIQLMGTAVGNGAGDAPVALLVDGKLFVTTAADDGRMTVPGDAVEALKQGNRLTLSFPSEGKTVETAFALKGSRKALDALAGNCPKADVPEVVEASGGSIEVADSYQAGQRVSVPFTAPAKDNAYWIGFVNVDGGPTDYISSGYAYVSSGNPAQITAPGTPGDYEIRMADDTDKVMLVAKQVTVGEPVPAQIDAPDSVVGGQFFQITHGGPDGPQNIVAIVRAGDPDSSYYSYQYANVSASPATTRAPATGGDYEVRYILPVGSSVVMARKPVTVSQAPAVTLTAAATSAGAPVDVALGDDAPRLSGDYIYIARPGADPGNYEGGYTYVPSSGAPEIPAPAEAGDWEVRYVVPDNGGWAVLGSTTLTVK